jgi:hypothetical protein
MPAIISGNEGRLTPEVIADFSKDYGAQWSDKKPTAKAAKETNNYAIGSAEGKRTGNRARQAHTYRNRAASCDCCMSDMVLATASTAA